MPLAAVRLAAKSTVPLAPGTLTEIWRMQTWV